MIEPSQPEGSATSAGPPWNMLPRPAADERARHAQHRGHDKAERLRAGNEEAGDHADDKSEHDPTEEKPSDWLPPKGTRNFADPHCHRTYFTS